MAHKSFFFVAAAVTGAARRTPFAIGVRISIGIGVGLRLRLRPFHKPIMYSETSVISFLNDLTTLLVVRCLTTCLNSIQLRIFHCVTDNGNQLSLFVFFSRSLPHADYGNWSEKLIRVINYLRLVRSRRN